ncbi:MAG: hypothetical protein K0U72_01935 [Gammaproteobacteria bacterium]|nr:hypothetical protein [Gammaproteobacteria bacterium]
MESVWIQVFVLTVAECVAPAGKSVCQEQSFELQFLTRRDCEYAYEQLITMKDELDNVIIDRSQSGCTASASEVTSYETIDSVAAASDDDWRMPTNTEQRRAAVNTQHRARLEQVKTCEESRGRAPCKIGEIIVEEATGDSVEVWRKN